MVMPCEAGDFRAGRKAGRAICFTLLKVLVGIPGNSAPGTTHLLPEQEKERERHAKKAGARPTRRVTPPCHSAPSRSCNAVSLPFLPVPVPVPVLCGRLLHKPPKSRRSSNVHADLHSIDPQCLVGGFSMKRARIDCANGGKTRPVRTFWYRIDFFLIKYVPMPSFRSGGAPRRYW